MIAYDSAKRYIRNIDLLINNLSHQCGFLSQQKLLLSKNRLQLSQIVSEVKKLLEFYSEKKKKM